MSAEERPTRPKRADAVVNHERLVQAAREVFADRGFSATLHDVAEHAGVGVGTIYRNFSSKQQIIDTLYEEAVERMLAGARQALQLSDPWQAIVAFFEVTAADQAKDRGLTATFFGTEMGKPAEQVTVTILD